MIYVQGFEEDLLHLTTFEFLDFLQKKQMLQCEISNSNVHFWKLSLMQSFQNKKVRYALFR